MTESKTVLQTPVWIQATTPEDNTWTSVVYGNGKFVAVSSGWCRQSYV